MNSEQTQSVVHLARLLGGAIRRGEAVADRLLEACLRCRDASAPDHFTSVGLDMWHMLAAPESVVIGELRLDLRSLLERRVAIGRTNVKALTEVARSLGSSGNGEGRRRPVLLGDAAVLLSLYASLASFEASLWVVALQGLGQTLMRSGTVEVVAAVPFDLRVSAAGRLAEPLKYYSRIEEAGGIEWLVPTEELMAVLLAARVGDPEAVPAPPMWFHLAVAILGWKEHLDFDEILELADDLELGGRVHRGLAITSSVFPEIAGLVPSHKLQIPLWERILVLPLAARRVVRESMKPLVRDDAVN